MAVPRSSSPAPPYSSRMRRPGQPRCRNHTFPRAVRIQRSRRLDCRKRTCDRGMPGGGSRVTFDFLFGPQQTRHSGNVRDVQLVDFNVERRIAFALADGLSILFPLVEAVFMTSDLQLPILRSPHGVLVAWDLDGEFVQSFRASEVRAFEVRAFEVRASEVRASEVRASEVRASDVRASEVRASGVRASEVRASEVRAFEVRDSEVRASEVRASEVRAFEV